METERVKIMKNEKNKVTKSDDDDDEDDQINTIINQNDKYDDENTKLLHKENNKLIDSVDRLSIKSGSNGDCSVCTNKDEINKRKRSDEPTELCFEKCMILKNMHIYIY